MFYVFLTKVFYWFNLDVFKEKLFMSFRDVFYVIYGNGKVNPPRRINLKKLYKVFEHLKFVLEHKEIDLKCSKIKYYKESFS